MALYKTHVRWNIFLIFPLTILGIVFFMNISEKSLIIYGAAFVYTTLFMNPDMDLAQKNRLFSLKGLLTLPFRLYGKIFSHRGISHIPVLGTLTRIVFLALFVILILLLWNIPFSEKSLTVFFVSYKQELFFAFWGAVLADISHEFLDMFS